MRRVARRGRVLIDPAVHVVVGSTVKALVVFRVVEGEIAGSQLVRDDVVGAVVDASIVTRVGRVGSHGNTRI